ncbi:hypothetical protein AP071_06375 [Rhodobacter capsulatus]|nr:hypothetical protein AP071_06375 [Rhodobacter capsulatus]KQB15937.1 hypothetical protein AP073_11920 [Rhodobacter capsulatus]
MNGFVSPFRRDLCTRTCAKAAIRGSLLPDASRSSSSHAFSFAVTGEPKISMIAFAAVTPTACSSEIRIRYAGSTSSALASEGTRSSGNLLLPDFRIEMKFAF